MQDRTTISPDGVPRPSSVREALLAARRERRCALIPYLTMGYPTLEGSLAVLGTLEEMGVDVVEVGIPFSDPVADGPTIQRTTDIALRQGVTLRRVLDALTAAPAPRAARVLFSYLNPLMAYGLDRLGGRLARAGCRGLLVTDLVPEEAAEVRELARRDDFETCFLVASTSDEDRVARAHDASTGFVYVVSTLGVTGARGQLDRGAEATVRRLRAVGDAPVAVGFGVSTPEDVRTIRSFAEGAIVGSRFLQALGDATEIPDLVARTREYIGPMLEAAHQ